MKGLEVLTASFVAKLQAAEFPNELRVRSTTIAIPAIDLSGRACDQPAAGHDETAILRQKVTRGVR